MTRIILSPPLISLCSIFFWLLGPCSGMFIYTTTLVELRTGPSQLSARNTITKQDAVGRIRPIHEREKETQIRDGHKYSGTVTQKISPARPSTARQLFWLGFCLRFKHSTLYILNLFVIIKIIYDYP